MKKCILTLMALLLGVYLQAQNMPLPAPNSSNTLFLKFSKTLNTIHAFGEVHVWNADRTNLEWKNAYAFTSNDNEGSSIDIRLYTPDKNYFGYTSLLLYGGVAITNAELRNILSAKGFYDRDKHMDSYSKIYLIDLDSPSPTEPNKYKIIEVKPYYRWKH